ncbi:MaoC/PaaZ C-terminal domain-containing protein [Lederbergia graminis]|uniref:MaoC/PaaZ C-terminal domain-containing protein n=1 Tax=Lederbergia graminis TaxID=735518 RepID=A0ABW0LER6_9BACI|nr:MaoC/PaaZ C-terminal domain-containing protein [Paenibacillus bovis]HLU20888.1 MaoC/PaaZ C-terminal domain-containing protein [Bacillaceae bacterium]
MILGKKQKLGRKIEEISVGEKFEVTEKMEDKELLLFLGLTNDANPLYIQHEYTSQTIYKKPIVPAIMLTGIITSAVSKYMPGPGSNIIKQQIEFTKPVHHYETVTFLFEITDMETEVNQITVHVEAIDENEDIVLNGDIVVCPPQ